MMSAIEDSTNSLFRSLHIGILSPSKLTVLIRPSQIYIPSLCTSVLFLAAWFFTSQQPSHTIIGATHDATIVERGNFVIAATLAPPFICYGTRKPKSVSCKSSIETPTWAQW